MLKNLTVCAIALSFMAAPAMADVTQVGTYVSNHVAPKEEMAVLVGKPGFDFEGHTSEGQVIHLSDFKGKFVVLEWNNPECPFVKKHYESGNMQRLQEYAQGEGMVWITINSGYPGKEGFMEARDAQNYYESVHSKANYYVIDNTGLIGHMYDAKTTPDIFIIDSGGYIAYSGAIDNKPTTDAEDIKYARNYVQDAIDNLMTGKAAAPFATQPYGCAVKYK